MNAISLTISAPIDEVAHTALNDFSALAKQFGIDYVLIGAKARELILHHHYGAPVLEENGYDTTLTAIQLLGERARLIAAPGTLAHVSTLLNDGLANLALEDLATDMSRGIPESVDECLHWLAMFKRGLEGGRISL
ncbi:hypothetical protein [Chromohalobacter nigrandesensis]|uniref:hypothetical protein n=1 Tax=Chromohalobacter nigrandesensis TaxID=119863 RepID=UPI001FF256C6|nr:hypothetical protein [Chromohalobacter nigrandesensis]MCK0745444.1 hypothetical protein [Chromohalobacter nigrandesensis]